MQIGVPKEIKIHEYRVGATPDLVSALVACGHSVSVQKGAGARIGFSDANYSQSGAVLVETAEEIYQADLILKVKEPQPAEYPLLKPGQILFCYLHLAPDPIQTEHLIKSGCIAIAYETVEDVRGRLPLLEPMSEIAGRLSVQVGALNLHLHHGGRGVLLGGVPGVLPGKVVIIGAGSAGTEAARMALGLGADVTILDIDLQRLRQLDLLFGPHLKTLYSTPHTIAQSLIEADLVIGAVLVPGKMAPKLITKAMIAKMLPGSVLVDMAIDQGGCSETSRPTSHSEPTYVVDGVTHYCVTNMPGACARTATLALTHVTGSYVLKLANLGCQKALLADPGFLKGLNIYKGHVTYPAVATDLNYSYSDPKTLLI